MIYFTERCGAVLSELVFGVPSSINALREKISGPEHGPLASCITQTRLCNVDPLKPHFYIVKLGFTGVYIIFLIFAQKHRLWVLVRTASPSTHNLCFDQKNEKYQCFVSENVQFLEVKKIRYI